MTLPDLAVLVREAPAEELPALLGKLAEAQGVVLARLSVPLPQAPPHEGPRNLSVGEAARRLGVSKPYLYKHAREYPFTVIIGSRVLFDSRGLEAWLSGQRPA